MNYSAGGADDELREITQRNAEYRPVGPQNGRNSGGGTLSQLAHWLLSL